VAAVSIRDLDDRVRERLRLRAARHGRSMEAEMRAILTDAAREGDDRQGCLPLWSTGSVRSAVSTWRAWSAPPSREPAAFAE